MVRAISIPNFRMIGRIVHEIQDRFVAQNTWTGDRVKRSALIKNAMKSSDVSINQF